ncbi:flippase Wzx [Streptococcus porcinus]|nr:flippase Wzx [Streptococcus porcinus]
MVSAVVYTISTIFTRGLAIITVPIFTRIMSSDQIGIVNLYNSWYAMLSVVTTLSLTSGGFAIAMKEYANSRDEYQSSILTLTSLVSLCLFLIYYFKQSFWQRITGLSHNLLLMMFITFLFAPAYDFWLARQRFEYKYKLSGFVSILSALLTSIASVVIVLKFQHYKYLGELRILTNYTVSVCFCFVIWLIIFFRGKVFYNKEYWINSLTLSIPLVGYSIAGQVLNVSDRLLISKLVNNSAVGIYSILYTVSSLSLLVWQAINASFIPYLFQNIGVNNRAIKQISTYLMILFSLVAILMTYFAPEIIKVLATSEYYQSIYIMPPIAAGVYFTTLSNIYSNLAIYYKNTKYVMYPAIIASIVNIIGNYILIQLFGYVAAAYTTMVSYIILAYLQYYWSKKLIIKNNKHITQIYDDSYLLKISIATATVILFGIVVYKNTLARYCLIIIFSAVILVISKKIYEQYDLKIKK